MQKLRCAARNPQTHNSLQVSLRLKLDQAPAHNTGNTGKVCGVHLLWYRNIGWPEVGAHILKEMVRYPRTQSSVEKSLLREFDAYAGNLDSRSQVQVNS